MSRRGWCWAPPGRRRWQAGHQQARRRRPLRGAAARFARGLPLRPPCAAAARNGPAGRPGTWWRVEERQRRRRALVLPAGLGGAQPGKHLFEGQRPLLPGSLQTGSEAGERPSKPAVTTRMLLRVPRCCQPHLRTLVSQRCRQGGCGAGHGCRGGGGCAVVGRAGFPHGQQTLQRQLAIVAALQWGRRRARRGAARVGDRRQTPSLAGGSGRRCRSARAPRGLLAPAPTRPRRRPG